MKRLRHRLGHWLLRDERKPRVRFVLDASGWAEKIRAELREGP